MNFPSLGGRGQGEGGLSIEKPTLPIPLNRLRTGSLCCEGEEQGIQKATRGLSLRWLFGYLPGDAFHRDVLGHLR
jgi:hypothetical protein